MQISMKLAPSLAGLDVWLSAGFLFRVLYIGWIIIKFPIFQAFMELYSKYFEHIYFRRLESKNPFMLLIATKQS